MKGSNTNPHATEAGMDAVQIELHYGHVLWQKQTNQKGEVGHILPPSEGFPFLSVRNINTAWMSSCAGNPDAILYYSSPLTDMRCFC